MIKTIDKQYSGVVEEKRSRFISNIFHVENINEVNEIIDRIKKKYYDSNHNVYAYRIEENNQIIERASDDGEPKKTAGAPILDIIKKQNLCNILIIVTRYFGGILLGTGGLVKAYSSCAQVALKEAKYIIQEKGYKLKIEVEYDNLEGFKYFLKTKKVNIIQYNYQKNVEIIVEVTNEQKEEILNDNNKYFKVLQIDILEQKYIKK